MHRIPPVVLILGAALVGAAGCAAMRQMATGELPPNAYGHVGERGGFSETRVSEDRFLVFFMGTWSDEERVADLAMLRAAELTLEQDYSHFEVLSEAMHTEGTDIGQGAAIPMGPIRVAGRSRSERFTATMLIQMHSGAPDGAEAVHDAETVFDELTGKYEIGSRRASH